MNSVTFSEVERLIEQLRKRRDPMAARRFACDCVRRIWTRVESQPYVSPHVMDQCRKALELTERSIIGLVVEDELREIDFEVVTDNGDDAFIAASHVGWNLFARINGLDEIDEYDGARQTAFLVARLAGADEINRQVVRLQILNSECDSLHTGIAGT